MSQSKKIWSTVCVMSVIALNTPVLTHGQSRGTGESGAGSGYLSGSAATGQHGTSGSSDSIQRHEGQDPSQSGASQIPSSPPASDQQLQERIHQMLRQDQALAPYAEDISIEVNEGTVTLRGPVKTEKDKADIGKHAQQVAGVKEVKNQLQIAPNLGGTTAGSVTDEAQSGDRSLRTPSSSSTVDDRRSSLDTLKQSTYVRPASSPYAAFLLPVGMGGERMRHPRGSSAAQNLSPDEFFTQAERDLVVLVRDNLAADPAVASVATDLEIGAEQGVVTVRGTVPDTRARDLIVAKVEGLTGVTRVDDRLRVTESTAGMTRDRVATDTMAENSSYGSSSTRQSMPEATPQTPPVTGFPATGDRGAAVTSDQALTGSGSMQEEDRTGTTAPAGSSSTSTLSSGPVDAISRTAKPAGDYAVTEVDRGLVGLIRSGFINHPDLLATEDNLHIKVDNGLVTLTGWARSETERQMIENKVREVPGVQGITNQLVVRPDYTVERNQ